MPTAHCVSTASGVVLTFDQNFCLLMGRSRENLTGFSYHRLTANVDAAESSRALRNLVDRAPPTRFKQIYMRPDGRLVSAEMLATLFKENDRIVATLSWKDEVAAALSPNALYKMALHVWHMYRCRIQELGPELFGDFVGAILLHVYLAEAEGRCVSVNEIAGLVGLSTKTTVRWVSALRQRTLISLSDQDVSTVQLSHQGIMAMERMLTTAMLPAG
jgi:hypothetical protein